jgi:ubiquinone/menaquinone biosynthesis C-methylase UbiE
MGTEPLKQTIANYWDGRSGNFERLQGIRTRLQKQAWLGVLSRTIGESPKSVLDVGTGTGFLALLVAQLGHRVKGLDLSPGMVEQARRNAAERDLAATFEVGDAETLPEADASYDVLVNRNVLWTLPRPEKAIADWKRVLKPGGLLVVVDGDWFDDRLSFRVQRFLGHLLVLFTQFKNPWAGEKRLRQGYDGGFDKDLPLKAPGNRQSFPRLIAEAGFTDVRLVELPEVDRAERAGKSLTNRLIMPMGFFAVVARRP